MTGILGFIVVLSLFLCVFENFHVKKSYIIGKKKDFKINRPESSSN